MLLFAEMPVLILPTAVLLVITIGRAYTVLAERLIAHSHDSGSSRPNHDLDDSQVRHA